MKRVIEFELTPEAAEAIAQRLPPVRPKRGASAWAVVAAGMVLAALAAAAAMGWLATG